MKFMMGTYGFIKMQRFSMNLNINPYRYLCIVRRPHAPVESMDAEPVSADIVIIGAAVPSEIIPIAVCDVEPWEQVARENMAAEFERGCSQGYLKCRNELIVIIIYLSIGMFVIICAAGYMILVRGKDRCF